MLTSSKNFDTTVEEEEKKFARNLYIIDSKSNQTIEGNKRFFDGELAYKKL